MFPPPESKRSGTLILMHFADRHHHTEEIRQSICAALGYTIAESYDSLRVYSRSQVAQIWISDGLATRERVNELLGLLAFVFDPDSIVLRRRARTLPEPLRVTTREHVARK